MIDEAVSALRRGEAIVYPTETLYGLGVDATSTAALERLAALKGRDRDQPVSVLVSSRAMLEALVENIPATASRLIDELWPGPLTLAFTARADVAARLKGAGGTLAARVSSHPVAQAIVERFGRPITATSANPGGSPAPAEIDTARAYFGDGVAVYVDAGRLAGGAPSTLLDCSGETPRLVRAGAILLDAIESVAGVRVLRE